MVSSAHQALDGFSPRPAAWFTGAFSAPTAAQAGAWQAIREGWDVLVVAPTGSGKTLAAFLAALDQLASTPPPGRPQEALPGALRVPAEGPRGRRRAQPAQPADRYPPGVRAPGPARSLGSGSASAPATPRRPSAAPLSTRPPDILITTPESAVPDADVGHARRAHGRGDGDPGRGCTRSRAPSAARISRSPWSGWTSCCRSRPAGSACRRPCARWTRWPGICPRAARWRSSSRSPAGSSTSPSSSRSRTWASWGGSPGGRRGGGRRAAVDLAARGGADRRPGPGPPVHDRLRQLPPPGGAAVQPAQRDRVRARDRRDPGGAPTPPPS